jgi:HprK-related kinase B
MSGEEQTHFEALAFSELWNAENKYDVPVENFYGEGRVLASSALLAVIILNWQHGINQPTNLQIVDIAARKELIAAIKKAPGPFYQDETGDFRPHDTNVDEAPYLALLQKTQVWELSGKVDFDEAVKLIHEQLAAESLCHG